MDAFVIATTTAAPSTAVPNYIGFSGKATVTSNEALAQMPLPHKLKLSKFRIDFRNLTAQGAGKGWTVQLRVNGATVSGISMTCTGSTISATYTATDSGVLNAGDKVCWMITPVSGPVSTNFGISICCIQTGDVGVAGYAEFFGQGSTAFTTTTSLMTPAGAANSTEASAFCPLPFNATLKNFGAMCSVDPTPGNWTLQLRTGGANAGSLSVSFPAGTAAGTVVRDDFATTGHSYATSFIGECLSVKATAAATPASSVINGSYTVEPVNSGDYALGSAHATNPTTTLGYGQVDGGTTGGWAAATEEIGTTQIALWQCTLYDMYLKNSATTGAGNTYTVTVRDKPSGGSAADTAMTGAVGGTTTTANMSVSGGVAVADGDYIDASAIASSGFTGRNVHIGIRLVVGSSSPVNVTIDMTGIRASASASAVAPSFSEAAVAPPATAQASAVAPILQQSSIGGIDVVIRL